MFCIYILRSLINNQYYIGCTSDLNERLEKHNHGYVRSTKSYRPWEMMYYEEFITLKEARKRELEVKSWKSRRRIEALINKSKLSMAPSSNG
jgi:putative endonuclease